MPSTPFYAYAHLTPLSQGIIASSVQLCYAWRVKVITSNILTVTLIVACATIGMRKLSLLLMLYHKLIFNP
jgi:hypothetical protein